MRLPIQVEGIVFRKLDKIKIEFLLLKRIASRGGFWQPITGGVEDLETAKNAMIRELKEETKITKYIQLISNVYMFKFPYINNNSRKGETIKEYVFGIEVDKTQEIIIDPKEHSEFLWVDFDTAISMLKWDTNKEALKRLVEIIK